MTRNNLLHMGIRQRLLLITLIPLLLITLILGGYFINTRLQDAEQAQLERGNTIVRLLASSSELGLLTGNRELLGSLIRKASNEDDVADIVFLNQSFEVVLRADEQGDPIEFNRTYPYLTKNNGHFLHPVVTRGVEITDSPEFSIEERGPEIIGWVAVILSQRLTRLRQQEIVVKGVMLALAGLVFTLLLASTAARQIINPIVAMTRVLEMLQHGHLHARSTVRSSGELRSLSEGINKLAHRVQESNQNLENQVDEATQRLRAALLHLERQNHVLSNARLRADQANLAKDEFLARMSHELRTPLTSVLGFSRLLEQTTLQPEQQEYTRIINLTSGLLLSIIDDILDFSKLESNAIKLECIELDIEACLQDVVEMQAPSAHNKGLELIASIHPETPSCLMGDPVRLRQILTNLVGNAIKFTEQGTVAVTVSPLSCQALHTELLISVSDTGIGISQQQLNHLFQAFSQADTSITRRFGGSGLGLVIARRLCELMGGTIQLKSTEGQGTEVQLKIPFAVAQTQPNASMAQQLNVLLYDSHPLVCASLEHQLVRHGLRAQVVDNVAQLTATADSDIHHAVVWGLPPDLPDSAQLQQILAGLDRQFAGKIVLLSCSTLNMDLPAAVKVLRKPVHRQHLLNSLLPGQYPLSDTPEQSLALASGIKVLVAEDNEFNRMLIHRIVTHAGAEVIEATTGREAVALTADDVDLVIMDVHMPEMDGIQATRAIRGRFPTLPILALTANVVASEHQRLRDAGVDAVQLKPINDSELRQNIQRLTQGAATTTDEWPAKPLNLADYQIGPAQLKEELERQLAGLKQGFAQGDRKRMRHHSHQLIGLAGLYELPELEAACETLHRMLHASPLRPIWQALWRLTRLIEHDQY